MAIKNFCLPVLCRRTMQGGWGLRCWSCSGLGLPFPRLRPLGSTSRAGHLLPVCPVVTVVGLGLLSAPTPVTPDEEERKLQSVEGARRTIFLAGQTEVA